MPYQVPPDMAMTRTRWLSHGDIRMGVMFAVPCDTTATDGQIMYQDDTELISRRAEQPEHVVGRCMTLHTVHRVVSCTHLQREQRRRDEQRLCLSQVKMLCQYDVAPPISQRCPKLTLRCHFKHTALAMHQSCC